MTSNTSSTMVGQHNYRPPQASSSRVGGGPSTPQLRPPAEAPRSWNAHSSPSTPQGGSQRRPQLLVLKDGEAIPPGYSYVVQEGCDITQANHRQSHQAREDVDLSTPPAAASPNPHDVTDNTKSIASAKRNLAKIINRKANATFAKELKESLATGRPSTIKIPESSSDLKCRWHAAAKDVAYKLLDLRKESWKEYSQFEKETLHREVNERYKFDPPIDPKSLDKYLSGHLRTARAVWKAHWQKYGDGQRHHNCPAAAWEKLIKWWPTEACKEKSAEMANRRAKVQSNSKQGRKSFVDKFDGAVSSISILVGLNQHSLRIAMTQDGAGIVHASTSLLW